MSFDLMSNVHSYFRDRNAELLNLDPQGKSLGHANLLPVLLGLFESL